MPAYAITHAFTKAIRIFAATTHMQSRIIVDTITIARLSMGCTQLSDAKAFLTILRPIEIGLDGVKFSMPIGLPAARAPISCIELMIATAIAGPFDSSHQKTSCYRKFYKLSKKFSDISFPQSHHAKRPNHANGNEHPK